MIPWDSASDTRAENAEQQNIMTRHFRIVKIAAGSRIRKICPGSLEREIPGSDVMKAEKIYEMAIQKWGEALQVCMAIEEMSELTKELIKFFRGKWTKEKIAEEIADTEIMLEQLKVMFKNHSLVESKRKEKLQRLETMLVKP